MCRIWLSLKTTTSGRAAPSCLTSGFSPNRSREDVQDFARVCLALAHDLRGVDVVFRFVIVPVAVVLQKRGRKLRDDIAREAKHEEQGGALHCQKNKLGGGAVERTGSGRLRASAECFSAMETDANTEEAVELAGVANAAVIDLFAVDEKAGQVLLVMKEDRPWDGSDERLHQLQEKFNAYVSFLLDGEMLSAHPELAGRKARIELHSAEMPDERALELLGLIHDQLALQEIAMEVVVADSGGCGSACSCHA